MSRASRLFGTPPGVGAASDLGDKHGIRPVLLLNPEAILFVEATADGDETWLEMSAGTADLTHWRFAAVPASSHEVHVTYRLRTVAVLHEAAKLRETPSDLLWVFFAAAELRITI